MNNLTLFIDKNIVNPVDIDSEFFNVSAFDWAYNSMNSYIAIHKEAITFELESMFTEIKEILNEHDIDASLEFFEAMQVDSVNVNLFFIIPIIFNMTPVLSTWYNIPNIGFIARDIFNTDFVQENIFTEFNTILPILIDNEASPELLAKIQNFGLFANEWYAEVGTRILTGEGISPEMLNIISNLGVT